MQYNKQRTVWLFHSPADSMRFVLLFVLVLPVAAQEPVAFNVPFEPIPACEHFDRPTAAVIRDADTWNQLHIACASRASESGHTSPYFVDFEREMVVVIYHGQTSNIQPNSARISQIERRAAAVLVWTGRTPNRMIEDELAERRADADLYDARLLPLTDSLSVLEHRRRVRRICERLGGRLTSPAFMHHVYAAVLPRIDLPVIFPNEGFQPDPLASSLDSSARPLHCER